MRLSNTKKGLAESRLKPGGQQRLRILGFMTSLFLRRGLSYTYPDSVMPALHDVNFTLEAGETLAIVGYNGSGKSTLAKILLRICDFDQGGLFINGVDLRKHRVPDYHKRVSAVFQGFSKYNYTLEENVGLGCIDKMKCPTAINDALHLAQADGIVKSLPHGLQTVLEGPGFEMLPYPGSLPSGDRHHHGLSGGEVRFPWNVCVSACC